MVNAIDRLLHTALQEAVRGRLLPSNPVDFAKPPRVEPKERQPLSDDEYNALLDAAAGTRLEAPIVTLLGTGLRRGELLAATWRNVDLDHRVFDKRQEKWIPAPYMRVVATVEETKALGVRIKEPKTKAGRRRVDLPAFVVETLRAHRLQQQQEHLQLGRPWSIDSPVFCDPVTGRTRGLGAFSQAVRRLGRKAGVDITVHGLRHEHFSRLLAAGEHPKVAQLRAGHSSIAVTIDLYSHASEALQQQAAARMENSFQTIREQAGGKREANADEPAKGEIIKL